MRKSWNWYMSRAVWLRVVLAIVAAFVLLAIIGALIPSEEENTEQAAITPVPTEAIARDQPTATPAPTRTQTPTPTPTPVPTPTPFTDAGVDAVWRKNGGETRGLAVSLVDGHVEVFVTPNLLNEADALTQASNNAKRTFPSIFETFPDAQSIRIAIRNEFTDQFGQKSEQEAASFRINRATADKINWRSLPSDNKNLFCIADNYAIHPAVYRTLRDTGCLRGLIGNR